MDTRRGLYSYPALQGRLSENAFATGGLVDFSGPVLRLSSLAAEDFFVLLQKIRFVYAHGNPDKQLVPDEAIVSFMAHCSKRLGDSYFRTPRTTITAFVNLLAVLEQNPDSAWQGGDPPPEIQGVGVSAMQLLPGEPGRAADIIAAEGRITAATLAASVL